MVELVQWAEDWYREHGRPWIYARQVASLEIANGKVHVEGAPLHGPELKERLKRSHAHGTVLVALGADPEAEREAARHWREERPEEYFFLETYASAVVEHLTTATGARLCQ